MMQAGWYAIQGKLGFIPRMKKFLTQVHRCQLNKQNWKFENLQYWSIMLRRVPDQEWRDDEVVGIDTVDEAMLLWEVKSVKVDVVIHQ